MLNFLSSKQIEKEIALPFKVVLELQEDGYFLASCPMLPGCSARGRSKSEALKNISEAVRHHLDLAASAQFEVVWQDATHPTLNSISAFFGRVLAGSNRDGALSSATGDYGSWALHPVSRASLAAEHQNGNGKAKALAAEPDEETALHDYTPQIYCLAPYAGGGVPRLFAGTSANGSIYESVDGLSWDLSYATGEARIHALAVFKNRLYAGSSPSGKLFCFSGTHWSLVHRSTETAITALHEFGGEFFMGTYPGGQIFASADGVNWHLAYDSEQTFVRAFATFKGHLYAATSKSTGGMVLRSKDGLRWEKVFESREPNFYCLGVFQHSLWLGTGNNGKLFKSEDGSLWALAQAFEDEGIRAMDSFEGRLYLATEGLGRVYRSRFSDTLPPEISDLEVVDVTSHSAVIKWRTDRPSDSRVRFGLSEDYDGMVYSSAATTEHRMPLSYLRSMESYHFKVFSQCPDHSETAFSAPLSFSTAGAETARIHSSSHPDPSRWYKLSAAQLSWNAPEGVTRFHYAVNREPNTVPLPGQAGVSSTHERTAQFGDLSDGEWWFHLLCEDRAGNLGGAAEHFCLRIDTRALPPRLSSPTHPVDGAWSNRAKASWAWEAPADLSGIAGYHVALDRRPGTVPGPENGQWTETPAFSGELTQDGDWYFHVASSDMAGNHGTEAAHYLIRLDRRADAPKVESPTHPDPSRWVNSSNVELQWSIPQDDSGIQGYYTAFDQKPETVPSVHTGSFTLSNSASYSGKGDGLWYFHVVSSDLAGNVGTEAAHFPVRIDTWAAPPSVSSPTHPQGTWVSAQRCVFEFTAPDDLSGTVGYYYVLDKDRTTVPSQEKGTYTTERSVEFSGLSDGLWTLHVVSKDAAGNVGAEAAHCSIRIDTEARPPILSSSSHPNQEEWSRQPSVEMSWEAPEDLSGIANYYWLFDAEPDTVPTAHSGHRSSENRARVEASEDGIWYFHVVSQDRAGNVGRVATHYKIRIDSKALPPRLICPTHPDRSAWSNHTRPRFEWFEPEDSSGIVGYYYCFDRNKDTLPTPVSGFYTTERYAVIDRGLEEDGTWWFHVVSRDRAGNVGVDAAHYPINLDTNAMPPQLSSSTHPDKHAWSSNPNPSFHWAVPDDPSGIAGYYYVLNHSQATVPSESNGTWTEENRASFAGLEDGVWTLHVSSRDRSGNVGTQAAHYSIRIDTQALPPQLQSPSHPEGAWVRNASPTFTWTPPQDLSGVAGYYYLIDREPSSVPTKETGQFTTGTLASFSRLEDGIWIFHIVSTDQAGNVGTRAAHYSVHIDTQANAPRVSSPTHPDGDKWYRAAAPQFSWSAPSDPSGVAGFYYCVDQASDTIPGAQSGWCAETQVSLHEYPDGEWYFHLVTKDGAGNLSLEAAHFRFRIDSTAPKPRIHSRTHPTPEDYYGIDKPSFVWEDGPDLSGIAGHYWVFDRQAVSPVLASTASFSTAGSVTLPPQKDGIWFFHLAAKDNAGNVSEASHYQVRIETQAPVSRLEPLPAVLGQPSFEIRWRGEDRVSGVAHYDVQFRQDGKGDWRQWVSESNTTSGIFSAVDGASYEFRVRATDKAGNSEPWNENGPFASVVVDLTPPEAVKNLAARPLAGGQVQLTWAPSLDNVSGVSHYEVYRSTSPGELGALVNKNEKIQKCSWIDASPELKDGALYYYSVVPLDKALNRRSQGNAQVSCLCDRSAAAPVLSSPTHPLTLDWYNLSDARLVWDTPADSTGIAGYYWSVDQSLNSTPGPKTGAYIEENTLEIKGLKDGTWYAHVVSKDNAGNISSEAAHYQINVDSTRPPAPVLRSPSHPNPDAWSALNEASFSWNTPNDPAKITGYFTAIDQSPDTVPGPSNGKWTLSNSAVVEDLGDGVWYFHVAAKDGAGNLGEQAGHCRVQVARSAPPPTVASPTHPRPSEAYSSRNPVLQWTAPSFSEPVVAYHFVLDNEKDTIPDAKDTRTVEPRAEFQGLGDGDWYFHAISVDSAGRLGRVASHFRFSIRSAGTLQGQVTKPNGILPLEGALVEVFLKGKSAGKCAANKEGRFKFDGLELGEYMLKLDAPGLPPQLFDAVQVSEGSSTLALSTEICSLPNPSHGAKEVRFYVLAKEPGSLGLKIYTESGTVIASLEAQASRPSYQKLAWDVSRIEPGIYLYQATLSGSSGKIQKYPIRKTQIT